MSALPEHPTERDRERFRDLTKAMQFGLEYDRRLASNGDYTDPQTAAMFRLWWSVERERQLLQNLNMSQGCKLSELAQKLGKAEAELARLRAAPNEIGLGKGEFVIWPVKINGVHGLAFVKTDDPKVVGTSHAEPEDGQIELGAGDSAIYFGNAESAMVLAERLQYVISLMTGSDAAPVPAVADKRVDELAMLIRRLVRRLNQELPHNDIGEAAMDYLARNGISGEILRGWAAPVVPDAKTAGIIKRLRDACPAGYGCKCMVNDAASELERLSALLQSTPQAPTVPDDRVSQDESTLTMAASALVLFRAGESAEYMAKAIEALLQCPGAPK